MRFYSIFFNTQEVLMIDRTPNPNCKILGQIQIVSGKHQADYGRNTIWKWWVLKLRFKSVQLVGRSDRSELQNPWACHRTLLPVSLLALGHFAVLLNWQCSGWFNMESWYWGRRVCSFHAFKGRSVMLKNNSMVKKYRITASINPKFRNLRQSFSRKVYI